MRRLPFSIRSPSHPTGRGTSSGRGESRRNPDDAPEVERQPLTPQMQAILLTSSLLLVAAMLASLAWLSTVRTRAEGAVPLEPADELQ